MLGGAPGGREPDVLVVDDDVLLHHLLVQVLEEEGCTVQAMSTGHAALAYLATHRPRVVIVDLRLPDLDGVAFTRLYRQQPGPHAPIVLMSADVEVDQIAEEAGIDAVLPKPFDLDDLLAMLRRYTDRAGD
jgi:CheY-like chemotaxis protein